MVKVSIFYICKNLNVISIENRKEEAVLPPKKLCGRRHKFRWLIGPVSDIFHPVPKRATLMLTLKDNQKVALHVQAQDVKGNPATLDPANPPQWTVSDPNILTFTADADNMGGTVTAVGALGTAQASVTATINGNAVVGTLDIQVVASDAVNLVISADTPADA